MVLLLKQVMNGYLDRVDGRKQELRGLTLSQIVGTAPRFICMYLRFMNETSLEILGETETRPRVSVSFFTRTRQEPTFNEEIC